MLCVIRLVSFAECHYADCYYAECRGAAPSYIIVIVNFSYLLALQATSTPTTETVSLVLALYFTAVSYGRSWRRCCNHCMVHAFLPCTMLKIS